MEWKSIEPETTETCPQGPVVTPSRICINREVAGRGRPLVSRPTALSQAVSKKGVGLEPQPCGDPENPDFGLNNSNFTEEQPDV